MKIWHDDIRRPPDDSWVWARTNDEAKTLLEESLTAPDYVEAISLDHDLGLNGLDPSTPGAFALRGDALETGYDLVVWMVEKNLVPKRVRIHSWSGVGARRMAAHLNDHGYDAEVRPYDPREDEWLR